MEFRLESSIFEENPFVITFSKDFRTEAFNEVTTVLNKPDIRGSIRQIELNGFCLIIKDIEVPSGYSVNITSTSPLFKLHFEVEGDYRYVPAKACEPIIPIPGGNFNICYFSKIDGTIHHNTTIRKTLEILFTEDFLMKAAGDDYSEILREISSKIKKDQSFLLWEKSLPIPVELQQNIKEIISCRYCGHIRKIYLEARITALLLHLLIKTDSDNSGTKETELPKTEYAAIHRVEEYIRQHFCTNITIADLAPIAGLNTSKLKQSFKKVHQTTIFKYITRLRMELAKDFISNERLSVSETSYKVGYKNPQHFTVAFKKYYGFLPSTLSGTNGSGFK